MENKVIEINLCSSELNDEFLNEIIDEIKKVLSKKVKGKNISYDVNESNNLAKLIEYSKYLYPLEYPKYHERLEHPNEIWCSNDYQQQEFNFEK